jgi:hypothetical protein
MAFYCWHSAIFCFLYSTQFIKTAIWKLSHSAAATFSNLHTKHELDCGVQFGCRSYVPEDANFVVCYVVPSGKQSRLQVKALRSPQTLINYLAIDIT